MSYANAGPPTGQTAALQETPHKHAGGRPTDYKPEFCQMVVELGREGAGKAEMAAACGVVRQTLDNWIKAHPEFLDAITARERKASPGGRSRVGSASSWAKPSTPTPTRCRSSTAFLTIGSATLISKPMER